MEDAETIVLEAQDQISGPASAAGASLESLENHIRSGSAALSEMQAQMQVMQGAASVDVAAFKSLSSEIEKQERAIKDAQAAYVQMGGSAKKAMGLAKAGSEEGSASFESLSASLKGVAGPMGGILERAQALKSGIGKAGLAGVAVAAAAAVVVLTAALIAGIAALFNFALVSADAARTQALLAQGVAGSVEGGNELNAAIKRIGNTVPLTNDELLSMASTLEKGGLKGKELEDALGKAATKAAKLKFGPDFAKQMTSLPVQARKLKENVTELFSGANIDKFLESLASVGSLLSQDTVIGQQLKEVITGAMQGFFDAAAKAMPYIKEGLVGVAIVAVQVYIAYAKIRNAILDIIGPTDEAGASADGLAASLELGKAAGEVIIATFAILAAIVAVFIAAVMVIPASFVAVSEAGKWVGDQIVAAFKWMADGAGGAWAAIVGVVQSGIDYIAGIDLASIGSALIDGLINGITGSIGAVVSAVSNLASSAIGAMKSVLDSHSPSRVFHEIGEGGIGGGLVGGVDASEPAVRESLENVVDPGAVKTGVKAAKAGGGKIVYIEKVEIGSREMFGEFVQMLRGEFEVEALDGAAA